MLSYVTDRIIFCNRLNLRTNIWNRFHFATVNLSIVLAGQSSVSLNYIIVKLSLITMQLSSLLLLILSNIVIVIIVLMVAVVVLQVMVNVTCPWTSLLANIFKK